MKKNKMMRLASLLLVAVMLTTCTISGTYAKYVTTGETTDKARVAKWGITITTEGDTFAETYAKDPSTMISNANSVVSSGSVNGYTDLVAPGTTGEFLESEVSGTPEVAFKVEYKLTSVKLDKWFAEDSTVYCPIIITVKQGGVVKGTVDGKGLATHSGATMADLTNQFESAINTILADCTKHYAHDETVEDADIVITWEWPFSTGDVNDEKDTWLGDQSALNQAGTIDVTLTTTVTQLD